VLRGGEGAAKDDAESRMKDEALIRQLQSMRNEMSAMKDRIGSVEKVRFL
jgi:hypothetical protein